MIQGIVFDIQKFCINDGPGIRTTVFLKGCTINCAWCHNPESKDFAPQLSYKEDLCVFCGSCERVCPNHVHIVNKDNRHTINRDACKACGECVEVCPTDALSIIGKKMSVEEVMKEVRKDKAYFDNSNGGLTLSGGEPLAQPNFALECAKSARKENISVVIESSLSVHPQILKDIVDVVDWFYVDYKLTDQADYKQFIGGSKQQVLNNLHLLNGLNAPMVLRCPIIPNINDNDKHFLMIATIAKRYKAINHVEVLPYHPMGKSKAREIGVLYTIKQEIPDEKTVQTWISKIKSFGYEHVVKG